MHTVHHIKYVIYINNEDNDEQSCIFNFPVEDIAISKRQLPSGSENTTLYLADLNQFVAGPKMSFLSVKNALIGAAIATTGSYTGYHLYNSVRETVMAYRQINETDAFTVKKIEEAYRRIHEAENSNSLIKKYLTDKVVDKLKFKRTKLGASLYDVIRSGAFVLDTEIGVYAPDTESYRTFSPLLDKVIEEYHGFSPTGKQPLVDFYGNQTFTDFPDLDPESKFIKSITVECSRSIAGFPFNPLLTLDDYHILHQMIKTAVDSIEEEDLKCSFQSVERMSKDERERLQSELILLSEGVPDLHFAKTYRYWPKCRGVYQDKEQKFFISVNQEDHLRLISKQKGSNIIEAYDRLVRGIKALESNIKFARDSRLGYLNFSPTNLGNAIKLTVEISLPKISSRNDFKEICQKMNLEVGPSTKPSCIHLSNKARLGYAECETIKQFYDNVKELVEMEKSA